MFNKNKKYDLDCKVNLVNRDKNCADAKRDAVSQNKERNSDKAASDNR